VEDGSAKSDDKAGRGVRDDAAFGIMCRLGDKGRNVVRRWLRVKKVWGNFLVGFSISRP
jgi:hypothetical protein